MLIVAKALMTLIGIFGLLVSACGLTRGYIMHEEESENGQGLAMGFLLVIGVLSVAVLFILVLVW